MSRTIVRLTLIVSVLALVATACGDDDEPVTTEPSTLPTEAAAAGDAVVASAAYDDFRSQPVACGGVLPDPAVEMEFTAPDDLDLSGTVTAILHTSCGPIAIELDADAAPETVNSFVFLAEQGYFDGTASHRVLAGFVIQAGDPTATGRGGPGYRLPDELPAADFLYTRGTVAMANAGPNTGGSQFFLVLADAPLPPAFTVFGRVVEGLDVMDAIAGIEVAPNASGEPSDPLESVFIERVDIER